MIRKKEIYSSFAQESVLKNLGPFRMVTQDRSLKGSYTILQRTYSGIIAGQQKTFHGMEIPPKEY
ncbi:hypothetical protein A3L09_05210 [Thermococcus profundus]|uniref:Uncharacterized protein n=1 Tax=Thermococcus profundus TaxID=49899 RepID=A0A2Z2MFL8_THEPR|nr:hypothetical protein A3L09_05210 [Thermococcus profundus]